MNNTCKTVTHIGMMEIGLNVCSNKVVVTVKKFLGT
jgi:hypothetical protein